MAEGFGAEVEHYAVDYDKFFNGMGEELVNRSLPFVQESVKKVLASHRITGETEASIRIRKVANTKQTGFGVRGEVYTDVEWAAVLEYTAVPFLRLGARKSRKDIRPLVKQIFGDEIRGMTRLKRRRK